MDEHPGGSVGPRQLPDAALDSPAMEVAAASDGSRPIPQGEVADAPLPPERPGPASATATATANRATAARARTGPVQLWHEIRFAVLAYVASRVLLLGVALADTALQHRALLGELANWDGFWYVTLAVEGYPPHASHLQTTLGFFPLYSMAIWLVAHALVLGPTVAGLLVSGVGGLIATVLLGRLCARWWGTASARRAVLLFCAFPGSVVFSMDYAEGLLIPLAIGCLLSLEQRRWLLAGVLAGLATAIAPDALAIVPVCVVAAGLELHRRGCRDRAARRSLLAPLLAPAGAIAFGSYLWVAVGSPFATFTAQHYGWGERTDPLALLRQAQALAYELSPSRFSVHQVNLNLVAGLAGAVLLAIGILLLLHREHRIPASGLVWTLGVAFLAVTSEYTPPNPRLLITAFPAVVVVARRLQARTFSLVVALSCVLLIVMSAITFVGIALRP